MALLLSAIFRFNEHFFLSLRLPWWVFAAVAIYLGYLLAGIDEEALSLSEIRTVRSMSVPKAVPLKDVVPLKLRTKPAL